MKPLILLLCLFISINVVFAQSSSVKKSSPTSGKKEDSTKVSLCSNSNGQQVFMITKGNGQVELQTVDQFLSSKTSVQIENNVSQAVSVKSVPAKSATPQTNGRESAVATQQTGKDVTTSPIHKSPPVLEEGPPKH